MSFQPALKHFGMVPSGVIDNDYHATTLAPIVEELPQETLE